MSARKFRRAIEKLEDRRLLSVAVLSNGTGQDGSVAVGVDAYGAFGYTLTGVPTQYSDFAVGNIGVIERSYVYFGPERKFLTSDDAARLEPIAGSLPVPPTPIPGGVEPDVAFTATTSQQAFSVFTLSGTDAAGNAYAYRVTLTQTLSGITPTDLGRFIPNTPTKFQSVLTQKYSVQNLLSATTTFNVDRYAQTQDSTVGGGAQLYGNNAAFDGDPLPTFGTTTYTSGGLTLVAGGIGSANFLQLRSFGGTDKNFAVQGPGLDGSIVANGQIPSTSSGVLDDKGDGVSDETGAEPYSQYFAGLAQERAFSVGPKETVEYTVTTTLGQSIPIELRIATGQVPTDNQGNPQYNVPQGDFSLTGTTFNFNFARDSSGVIAPLLLQVNRLNGTSGAVTVNVNILNGTTPAAAISTVPTTVTFADGQRTAFVRLAINPALAGAEPSSFQVALGTPTVGASTVTPAVATVNVLPQAAAFSFSSLTYSAQAAQTNGALTVTILRGGNTVGPASVIFSTVDGTALAGRDYTKVLALVNFADGQASTTVTVPLLLGRQDNSTLNFLVNLTSTTPNGSGTGVPSVIETSTAVVTFRSIDAGSPFVTRVMPVAIGKSIASVVLFFSETLRNSEDISAYSLYLRSSEAGSGAARLKTVPIRVAGYNSALNAVSLVPVSPLKFNTNYQVTVRSTSSITDVSGNPVNQNPGTTVSSFVGLFAYGNKIAYSDASGDAVTLTMTAGNFALTRFSSGEAATATLFGNGPGSVLSGSIRKTKAGPGSSTINQIVNNTASSVRLPSNITVNSNLQAV